MILDITGEEVETLLDSLAHSKLRIGAAEGTPSGVRKETMARLEAIERKLKAARGS
jgi:hypothetical protein